MNVTLREITMENFRECIELRLNEMQKGFVASNVFSLAEAKADGVSNPWAIYAGEQMVGFIMYDFNASETRGYITRLMIDERYQGRGYGRAAMQEIIDLFSRNPACKEIYTSVVPKNSAAKHLYQSMGFSFTGEIQDGEEAMIIDLTCREYAGAG